MPGIDKEAAPAHSERARWDGRFAAEGFHFGTEPNAFLVSQRPRLRPGMTALSIADGEGRNSVWLAKQGLRVRAFDFSPVGIEKARGLAERSGVEVEYLVADVLEWNWDERRYDVIAGIFIQFATPGERAAMFRGMMRSLAPGGLLLLQGYRTEQLQYRTGGPSKAEQLYTESLLRESFAPLEILHLRSHDETIDEGHGHRGMSALIDLVARNPGTKPSVP